jgi:hypothetical protein
MRRANGEFKPTDSLEDPAEVFLPLCLLTCTYVSLQGDVQFLVHRQVITSAALPAHESCDSISTAFGFSKANIRIWGGHAKLKRKQRFAESGQAS